MDAFTERFRAIVARYLDGNQSLEAAATDFAEVWKEWHKTRLTALRADTSSSPEPSAPGIEVLHAGDDLRPGMTEDDFPRVVELMDRASQRMSQGDKGAA